MCETRRHGDRPSTARARVCTESTGDRPGHRHGRRARRSRASTGRSLCGNRTQWPDSGVPESTEKAKLVLQTPTERGGDAEYNLAPSSPSSPSLFRLGVCLLCLAFHSMKSPRSFVGVSNGLVRSPELEPQLLVSGFYLATRLLLFWVFFFFGYEAEGKKKKLVISPFKFFVLLCFVFLFSECMSVAVAPIPHTPQHGIMPRNVLNRIITTETQF